MVLALPWAGRCRSFIVPGSMLFTDEYAGYLTVGKPYRHRRIRHRDRIYVEGDVHTQAVEGFFGLFKTGVRGAHHSISTKWLQGYLNEWVWRYNRRDSVTPMFDDLLAEGHEQNAG
ncbi:MAG TPA: transposase [Gaiellaceae bacterium]|nr:transposase [Gaiellaceae bacterium]